MENIIYNSLKKLNKKSTFDEIKSVLKSECKKSGFSIDSNDWNYMFDVITIKLNE